MIICIYRFGTRGNVENKRAFQGGMDIDKRRRCRQNEQLTLRKKERKQRKASKRRKFSRDLDKTVEQKIEDLKQVHVFCTQRENSVFSCFAICLFVFLFCMFCASWCVD